MDISTGFFFGRKKVLTNISHCDTISYIEVRYIEVEYT